MEPELCPICYDPITNKLSISCNHTFCTECIIKWFRHGNPQCPVCRDAPEMEKSDTEFESEDTYQEDINKIIVCINNTFKMHPQNKELKQKVKECKQIRKEFKDVINTRIKKSIEIELNKITKKKKVLFEEVIKLKNDINKACISSVKKIDQESISKDRIKYFVKNKVHRAIHGNISPWRMELISNNINMPKELKIISN